MTRTNEQMRPEVSMRIGCVLVFPVAFFGTLMIADYPGPPGPIGAVEFFGWWAVCIATAYCCGRLLRQFRQRASNRLLFFILAMAMPIALGLFTWLEIQPSTPTRVKQIVEYSLQVVGVGSIAAILLFIAWIVRNSRK
jgi:hypothetical protein